MKKLYVVATPIGNLNEINNRAINSFNCSNIIYCEDTRVTKKLFNLLNIDITNKTFISLTGFNEKEIINKINFNNNHECCLVSDAGYPIVSDPGYNLINECIKRNISVEIINGPSSLMHALVASGFSTNSFYFVGFLSNSSSQLNNQLNDLYQIKSTLIIFESVHRIKKTLEAIKSVFGELVNLVVCKELTKMNETIYRGNIDSIIKNIDYRGEFVIVIDNNINQKNTDKNTDLKVYLNEVLQLVKKGNQEKVAAKMVAYKYDLNSKELFNALQVKKNII